MDEKITEICKRHADICSIFTNPRRMMILRILGSEEKSVGAIAEELGIPEYAISQHLRVMKDRLVVRSRKEGRTVYYRISNSKFMEGIMLIRDGLLEELEKMNLIITDSD